jgi:hypothetical protein
MKIGAEASRVTAVFVHPNPAPVRAPDHVSRNLGVMTCRARAMIARGFVNPRRKARDLKSRAMLGGLKRVTGIVRPANLVSKAAEAAQANAHSGRAPHVIVPKVMPVPIVRPADPVLRVRTMKRAHSGAEMTATGHFAAGKKVRQHARRVFATSETIGRESLALTASALRALRRIVQIGNVPALPASQPRGSVSLG